jgi:hypothetical protein
MTPSNQVLRSRWLVICALCYALVLSLSISGSSLWTDEAFSAWLASQVSFRSLAASLLHGGASDLQMALYYIYLFLFAKIFGTSEFALRAANIPFILLFSFALVWSSWRIFRSRVVWLAPAMLPFVWHYASEARPYMALLALGTVAFASLLRFVTAGPSTDLKPYPWICISCIVVGSLFHMLFLLAVAPLLLILGLAYISDRSDPRWSYWRLPLVASTLAFSGLGAYFAFTFYQGALDYTYPAPGLRQMGSVAFELLGLSNFGPNRKFSVDFRPYAVPLALGTLAIGFGFACAGSAFRRRNQMITRLTAAVSLGCAEVGILCLATHQQLDARHLAGLVPVFLLLLMSLIRAAPTRAFAASLILLSGGWLAADLRAQFLPEYQKEDYRDAVQAALSLHRQTGAELVIAADPVGSAYYGADVHGPAPCYPILVACGPAFQSVPWPRAIPAINAGRWNQARVQGWLSSRDEREGDVVVLLRLDRNHRDSGWPPVLATDRVEQRLRFQGFEIDVLKTPIHSDAQPALGKPASSASPSLAAAANSMEAVHK